MKFKQNLSLLFWLYRGKASKDGKAPIYFRITIDGTDTDISLGKKIHPGFWNSDSKLVSATTSEAKIINMKIVQLQAEIEKHFLVLQSQFNHVTPMILKNAYLGLPLSHFKAKPGKAAGPSQTLLAAFDAFIAIFEKKAN